jgi:hypothetical protein
MRAGLLWSHLCNKPCITVAGIKELAYRGVAIRNFALKPGHGFADYLLYVDGRTAISRRPLGTCAVVELFVEELLKLLQHFF